MTCLGLQILRNLNKRYIHNKYACVLTRCSSSACPDDLITRSVILNMNERGALSMACIGFDF
jgi:hypothetical protein